MALWVFWLTLPFPNRVKHTSMKRKHGPSMRVNNFVGNIITVLLKSPYPFLLRNLMVINCIGSNLFQVAVHEFGHVLGLSHSDTKADVMTPTYDYRPDFKLETGDISRIQVF
jgi:hypothetical protein